MLTQLSQSSKRLGKLKKYRTKLKQSGFQFLLQSLDRDKENHVPNAQNNNQLVQSVQIDPILTAPAHSLTVNLASTINNSKKGNFFMENVKVLEKSDMSIKDVCEHKNSKKSKKDKENCSQFLNGSKKNYKDNSQFLSNESKNTDKNLINDIICKMKEYIMITNQLILPKEGHIMQKRFRKSKKLESQLINLITNLQQQDLKQRKSLKMRNSVNTTSFNIFGNDANKLGKGSEQYLKIINSLEFQKQKLNSLISRHELANIKMFIKINEGQSEQIQMCKKQLAMLFDKYKKLQALISNDKKKIIQITKEKQVLVQKNNELTFQNQELLRILQTSQLQFEKKKDNNMIRLQKRKNNYSELDVNKSHARQQSIHSIYQNSLNNRSGDLHLQSLNNSQFSQEPGLGSSITTTTSRMLHKKGGRLGINLNALLENTKQSNINKLIEDPQKLKKMMNECRNNIITMENIISQQNKELQFSIKALEQNKIKIQSNQSTIKNLQSKLKQLNKIVQKMKKQKTEKEILKEVLKENKQYERNKCTNENRSFRNNKQIDYRQIVKQPKKDHCIEGKDKKVFNIDLNSDYYRIIALQAQTIQQIYCQSKRS